MKKQMVRILTLCLLLSCTVSALAATPITPYTLEQKLGIQMQMSGFDADITFSAEGDGFFHADSAVWAVAKNLLSSLKLTASSTVKKRTPQRESLLQIEKNGAVAGEMQLLYDGHRYALKSDLISAVPQYFLFDKNMDWKVMMQAAGKKDFPAALPMLLSVKTTGEEWQKQFEELLSPYTTDVAMWMQSFLQVTMPDENGHYSMMGEIPAHEVKNYMKKVIGDFYRDEKLLAHLRQALSATEQAAYLNPAMQSTFVSLINQMPLEDSIVINRAYDGQGLSLLDSIEFPFVNGPMKKFSAAVSPSGAEKSVEIKAVFADDRNLSLQILTADNKQFHGFLKMDQKDKKTQENKLLSVAFEMYGAAQDETYDLEKELCERIYEAKLQVKVQDDDTAGTHDFTLTADSRMASQPARAASTHIDSVWTLRDDMAGGQVTMTFKGQTVSSWDPVLMEDVENGVELTQKDLMATAQSWLTRFGQWMQNFLMLGINP